MSKSASPKWQFAPRWAKYLAQDANGKWWFFSAKPVEGVNEWMCQPGQMAHEAGQGKPNAKWRDTLEAK